MKTTRKNLNVWKKMSQTRIKKGSIEIKLETVLNVKELEKTKCPATHEGLTDTFKI